MEFSPIHHVDGGTLITNFSNSDLHIYEEAIRRYGKSDLQISRVAYYCNGAFAPELSSLHRAPSTRGSLSDFWAIHKQVKEERKGKDIVIVFMDGTTKVFSGVKEVR